MVGWDDLRSAFTRRLLGEGASVPELPPPPPPPPPPDPPSWWLATEAAMDRDGYPGFYSEVGLQLLMRHLDPKQREQFARERNFEFRGSSGRHYKLGHAGDTCFLFPQNGWVHQCLYPVSPETRSATIPYGIPWEDVQLGIMLRLMADDEGELKRIGRWYPEAI